MSVLNELDVLRRVLPQLQSAPTVLVGPGDDCAVLAWTAERDLLVTVDQVVAGVHFTPETPPEPAGAKLMKRNLSDIAAMGGTPLWAVLATGSGGREPEYVERFILGAARAGEEYGAVTVGGDLSALPEPGFAASLTLIGEVPHGQALLRSGARPGDRLYVSGAIGNSFGSGWHLTFVPRLEIGRALRGVATAMLDVSDGLLLDARRLAQSSGVDLLLDSAAVPLRSGARLPEALGDGEDYELLFTAPDAPGFTAIGRVLPGSGRVLNPQLQKMKIHGYEH